MSALKTPKIAGAGMAASDCLVPQSLLTDAAQALRCLLDTPNDPDYRREAKKVCAALDQHRKDAQ